MATIYCSKSGFDAAYVFTCSGITITPLVGATYTNNAQTFTVIGANIVTGAGNVFCSGTGAPSASGTLTKTAGTGDSSITFSATPATGSTYAASKLTIGAGITASANGTVIVGSGLYNEKINVGSTPASIYYDGIVVLDGTGIANTNSAITFPGGGQSATLAPYTSGGVLIVQNHSTPTLINTISAAGVTFTNAVLISNNNALAYQGGSGTTHILSNIVFSGFTTGVNISSGQTFNILNCTFYNGTTGVTQTSTGTITLSNCIFSNFTTAWNFSATETVNAINTNHYYTITNWIKGASTYTTLGQVQSAGYDTLSAVADPQFTDPANNIFYLKAQSSVSPTVGMYPYGLTRGAANDVGSLWHIIAAAGYDNSGWYNPDGNITKNGTTGYFELTSGSSGQIWSPVMNLGTVQNISQLNLEVSQTWPTNMADSNTADIRPNYQTSEIRASNSSFNQNDGVIAWTTVKNNIPFNYVAGQYVQIRITLTSVDVGA